MMKRRRVEGVAQSAIAPVGAGVGEEREAWAGIGRNKIIDRLGVSRK
jgi:hypothetical protein